MKEPTHDDPLERLIETYYRVETAHVHAAPGLWRALERQIGKAASANPLAATLRGSVRQAMAEPSTRRPRIRRYIPIAALAAAGLAIAVGVSVLRSADLAPAGLARVGPATPSAGRTAAPTATVAAPGENPAPATGTRESLPRLTPSPDGPQVPATPALSVSPRLQKGSIEEAEQAVGVTILLPRYLPADAEREDELVFYHVADGGGMASIAYRVGQGSLALEFIRAPAGQAPGLEGEPAAVGTFQAVVHTTPREPSDPLPPLSEVAWRDGEVTVRVWGDLPVDELLRVARSLY